MKEGVLMAVTRGFAAVRVCVGKARWLGAPRSAMLWWLLAISGVQAATSSPSNSAGWLLDSGTIDPAHYAGVTVANGMIGLLSVAQPFGTQQAWIAGAYEPDASKGVRRILQSFDFLKLDVAIDSESITRIDQVSDFHQVLDMQRAALTTSFRYRDKADIRYTLRALRQLPFNSMIEVTVSARRPVMVRVNSQLVPSPMLRAIQIDPVGAGDEGRRMLGASAEGIAGVQKVGAAQTFLFDQSAGVSPPVAWQGPGTGQSMTFSKSLGTGESHHFALVGATITSTQASDPLATAQRLTIFAAAQGIPELISAHERVWRQLWMSDIRIDGDESAQRGVHSMLYHLYAFGREGSGNSIAPMGLSGSSYSGHIFWDAELWMFPALVALHPEIAQSMLEYRFVRLAAARRNAAAHGFRGAMFPWESAERR